MPSAFDSLLGTIWNRGLRLDLLGGLNFTSPLFAKRNESTRVIDIGIDSAALGGGGATLIAPDANDVLRYGATRGAVQSGTAFGDPALANEGTSANANDDLIFAGNGLAGPLVFAPIAGSDGSDTDPIWVSLVRTQLRSQVTPTELGTNGLTLSLWFKALSTISTNRYLFGKEVTLNSSQESYSLGVEAPSPSVTGLSSTYCAQVDNDVPAGTTRAQALALSTCEPDGVHHMGLTINAAQDTLSFYFDGELAGQTALATVPTISNGPWYFGGPVSNYSDAMFHDARGANVERPASWFREMFASGAGL